MEFLVADYLSTLPRHLRKFEKGAFARGALRKFVADCAPNLLKITVFGVLHQRRGVQNCRKIVLTQKTNCRRCYANTPFPMPPSPIFCSPFFVSGP